MKITVLDQYRSTTPREFDVPDRIGSIIYDLLLCVERGATDFQLSNGIQEKSARKIHFDRKPKDFEECLTYAENKLISHKDAYAWFSQMEANGWTLSSGNPIKNWRAHLSHYQAEGWLQSQRGQVR